MNMILVFLGTPHGFGMRRGLFDGRDGKDGMQGKNGSDGTKPVLGMSFRKSVTSLFDPKSMYGHDGKDGENGENGEDGLNGGACRITEINLRSIVSEVPVIIGVIP